MGSALAGRYPASINSQSCLAIGISWNEREQFRLVRGKSKEDRREFQSLANDLEEIASRSASIAIFPKEIAFHFICSRATQRRSPSFAITRDLSKSEALGFESAAENPNRSWLDLKVSRLHSRELASDLNRRRSIQTDDIPFKTSAGNPKQIAFWVKSPL